MSQGGTQPGSSATACIWGLDRLSGPPERDVEDGGWSLPLDPAVAPPAEGLPRADPVPANLEMLGQPQAANPSFVTVPEFATIDRRLRA
ncbi:hypothetical protein [Actinoplanes sp. NPDC051411]|uniref:hypothetical protein n=1 Tax=Actinoplanes sp. NPDC051411 TaxID=3155522 RepID=UPI00342C276A